MFGCYPETVSSTRGRIFFLYTRMPSALKLRHMFQPGKKKFKMKSQFSHQLAYAYHGNDLELINGL